MRTISKITVLSAILFLSLPILALATDGECTPPYSGWKGTFESKELCEDAIRDVTTGVKVCVQSVDGWEGYASTKAGSNCTLDGSGSAGTCNVAGDCILTGQCDPVWNCTDWSPLESDKTCGASFTQRRTCTDFANCGTNTGKPLTSQIALGTSCPDGQSCNSNNVCATNSNPTTPNNPSNQNIQSGTGITITNPLNFDNVQDLLNAVIDFIFWVGMAVAPVVLIIAGFMYVTAGDDSGRVTTAQKMMWYTILGLVILLSARGLVAVLRSILGVK